MPGIAKLKYSTLDRYDAEGREYTAHYTINGVGATEGPTTIILASGLPQLGDYYVAGSEYDTFAVVIGYSDVSPTSWEGRVAWKASVKYSTIGAKQTRQAKNTDNPIDKPPILSGTGHRRRVPAHLVRAEDTQGRAVLNAAKRFFPDGEVDIDDSSNVLRITRSYASINLDTLDDFKDSVNVNAWMGKPARTWKMDPAQWRKVYWGNTAYYEISYSFQGNAETWDLKPRNLGDRDINGELPEKDGIRSSTIEILDENGAFAYAINLKPTVFDGVGAHPNPFRWYKERDFTQLGLPEEP